MSNQEKPSSRPGYLLNCTAQEKLEFFAVCKLRGAVPASYVRQWMRSLVSEEKKERPSDFASALIEVKTEVEALAAKKKAKDDVKPVKPSRK